MMCALHSMVTKQLPCVVSFTIITCTYLFHCHQLACVCIGRTQNEVIQTNKSYNLDHRSSLGGNDEPLGFSRDPDTQKQRLQLLVEVTGSAGYTKFPAGTLMITQTSSVSKSSTPFFHNYPITRSNQSYVVVYNNSKFSKNGKIMVNYSQTSVLEKAFFSA